MIDKSDYCEFVESELQRTMQVFNHLQGGRKWEMIKFEAANISKEYAWINKQKEKKQHFNMYRLLSNMQEELVNQEEINNVELVKNMERVKAEIDAYEKLRLERARFRSRAKWEVEGEKATSYYFNLERRNYIKKTMYVVKKANGALTKDYTEILNEQVEYFKTLYKKDENVKFDQINTSAVQVPPNVRNSYEKFITKEELFDGLMTHKPGKTPSLDGLSLKFYRKFWKILIDPYYDMLLEAFQTGLLSISAKRGLINLIPKSGKDDKILMSWRLITILNYDYKIYAKTIANRIDVMSPTLVSSCQTGFVKGRSIFTNTMKVREVVAYLNKKNLPGVIAIVDYEKCFDRLAYGSIARMLKFLGYGPEFVQMVMIMYNNFQVCTQNNGFLSQFLPKGRGVNQRCPASPGIYVQTSSLIEHLNQQKADVLKGISLGNLTLLLSQFADDTSAFLKYELLTIKAFCEILESMESQLGLKVSYNKTSLYRVGSLSKTDAELYTKKPLKWTIEDIETLGLIIPCDSSRTKRNV